MEKRKKERYSNRAKVHAHMCTFVRTTHKFKYYIPMVYIIFQFRVGVHCNHQEKNALVIFLFLKDRS